MMEEILFTDKFLTDLSTYNYNSINYDKNKVLLIYYVQL